MSESQLKAFQEKVKSDTSLQAQLQKAADNNAIVAIAKDAGFRISEDDIDQSQEMTELSEEELMAVTGGRAFSWGVGNSGL